jgi:hypothetical protein
MSVRATSTAILGGVGGGNAREQADVVTRSAPKDKPDLVRLKDDAKFALVALEPKHPDRCLSEANWADQPKSLGQKAYRHRIDPP